MDIKKTTASDMLQHVRITELECSMIEIARGRGALFLAMQPTFHLVLNGSCHLIAEDGSFDIELAAGDFVVVPRGLRHSVGDTAEVKSVPARDAERVPMALARDVPTLLRFRDADPPAFRILSGVFRFPPSMASSVMAALPAWLCLKAAHQVCALSSGLAGAVMEPGGKALLWRLADLLLLEAVRQDAGIMAQLAKLGPVWLRTYRIERAVAAVMAEPAQCWTLTSLARLVGMSRASFAEKYQARISMPPMQHVAIIRLDHAAMLLRSTALAISEVARQSGYSSDSSFARGFRLRHGITPRAYRKAAWVQPLS